MSKTSGKSHMVSFRMSNEAYEKIKEVLLHRSNNNSSVSDYCKQVVERHVFRHTKTKYRRAI